MASVGHDQVCQSFNALQCAVSVFRNIIQIVSPHTIHKISKKRKFQNPDKLPMTCVAYNPELDAILIRQ